VQKQAKNAKKRKKSLHIYLDAFYFLFPEKNAKMQTFFNFLKKNAFFSGFFF